MLFSFARNSCSRNHHRYTLCGSHWSEEHEGDWQTCEACRTAFATELYVWFGTNEYNFEKLADPPPFQPTYCASCHRRIRLGTDGYVIAAGTYLCESCGVGDLPGRPRRRVRRRSNT